MSSCSTTRAARFAARGLLLLALVGLGASGASCGNVKIPDGALICGNGHTDGGACPAGFTCGPDNRCHITANQDGGHAADAKVDLPVDVAGDVAPSEGGGPSCPALDNPEGGTVSAPALTLGSVATYSCGTGLGPSGSSTRTCQADGWDGTQPMCVVANCPPLASPIGGIVDAPTLTFGVTATYSCNNGYTLNGTTTRTCQTNKMWSGAAPTCDPKDCGPPMGPVHGTVSAPTTTVGAVATNMCDMGYTLSGAVTRTCQADQTWSATTPTCAPVDCMAISVANGMVTYSSGTTLGSAATYTCNANFQLSGTSPVTCLSTGKWSGAPTCVDVCTVAGNHGTASHCCDSNPCVNPLAPTCNTTTHVCGSTPSGGGCSAPGNCATGMCVQGICCQTACNTECWADCGGAGGTCRPVAASARKQCGTPVTDNSTNHATTAYLLCDGTGQCKGVSIHCGGSASLCTIDSTTACCNQDTNPTSTPPVCTTPRVRADGSTPPGCLHQANDASQNCTDSADCPSSMVCCNDYSLGYWVNECLLPGDCTGAMNASIACDGRTPCTSPKTCKNDSDFSFTTSVVKTCQ